MLSKKLGLQYLVTEILHHPTYANIQCFPSKSQYYTYFDYQCIYFPLLKSYYKRGVSLGSGRHFKTNVNILRN